MVEKHARELANEDHSESQPKFILYLKSLLYYCDCSGLRRLTRLDAWRYGLHARKASAFSILSTSAEVTKYVGCAVASAIAGCGEANLISEHKSNTIELQLHTTDLQQHYLFRAGHDLQIEHRFDAMIIEQQGVQHRIMKEQNSSEPWGEPYRGGLGTVWATFE